MERFHLTDPSVHLSRQAYGRDLMEAQDWCRKYMRSGNVKDLTQAWDLYYHVFRRISKQLPQVGETVLTPKASGTTGDPTTSQLQSTKRFNSLQLVTTIRSIHPGRGIYPVAPRNAAACSSSCALSPVLRAVRLHRVSQARLPQPSQTGPGLGPTDHE